MSTIDLYKKQASGNVVKMVINDKPEAVKYCLMNGFFLTEEEAKTGQVKSEEPTKPVRKKRQAKPKAVK